MFVAVAAVLGSAWFGASLATGAREATCSGGTVTALIGGKRVCLKVGQKCLHRHEARFARSGLTCRAGRLVRRTPALRWVLTDLGVKDAVGINGQGQVAGSYAGHPFVWKNGVTTDIGTLGGSSAYASAINDRGQIIGQANERAFLWQKGRMTDLGTLGGGASFPFAVNSRGQVIGLADTATGAAHLFFWQHGLMTDLGFVGSATLDDSGRVVGFDGRGDYEARAFLWLDGKRTDLGTLGGRANSYALTVTERGQIIGQSETSCCGRRGGSRRAFLWQNGKMRDLGTLGGRESLAFATNERGQIVGASETARRKWHAFVWESEKMTDLGTLAGKQGLLYPNSLAGAINEHGQILGQALLTYPEPSEGGHAIVWTLRRGG